MVAKIIKVFPLNSREYTDRMGQKAVFKSKGFIINAGEGNIYAEAVQETATAIEELKVQEGEAVFIQLQHVAREYKDGNGLTRYSNEVTIRQLLVV